MEILEEVLREYEEYDYNRYTRQDAEAALTRETIGTEDYKALLSPAAMDLLEPMAKRAKKETLKHFGNSVSLFTPLYIANYCVNHCVYCGFNCTNKIHRAKLTMEEIEKEYQAIAKTGLKEILILTGESKKASSVEYIGEAVELAKKYFSTIGIEVYPMDVDEYEYIHKKGADFVSVYQETYNTKTYDEVHVSGPKKVFPYRLNAQERALQGGMRGVGCGALLGLDDFRKDAFASGIHAYLLQRKYPRAEVSFSVPRLRPYKNNETNDAKDVHEKQLLQVMLAHRLFMPFAGITISTRERAGFRDHVVGMAATKISAGVSTGVGGHEEEEKGDAQFMISDPRSVDEVAAMLAQRGMQGIYTDYVRV
ncbi:2-iminoacetate synthase ThiH [Anaerostipes sp.]|uniref:2-iminoacetate synthase ThiH n=1 Tax=Anaerostipes sp. TaxID=1872530 RepID=UPI0025B7D509|nr:2-iminoacetate synthase ThiH [Anaerostipes sp.]MBS7008531.1 2-iminoacetate synthase ThiH [Anaerostipes sp.]